MPRRRVLYIHHGGAEGGAPLSLLQLLRAMEESVEPVVCSGMEDRQVIDLFSREGFETCSCLLPVFNHTALRYYSLRHPLEWQEFLAWLRDYRGACRRLKNLLISLKPDLVHLNSLTLAPYAPVARLLGIPAVVHVREPVAPGILGLRKGWLRRILNNYADEVICICKDNLDRLALRPGLGKVIYNPVDFSQFDWRIDKNRARGELGLPLEKPVVCYAGGGSLVKGPDLFIEAMKLVARSVPDISFLTPSFTRPEHFGRTPWRRRLGKVLFPARNRFIRSAASFLESGRVCAPRFRFDMQTCIAAADVLCIPHARPHFSRVVMEAGAMKRPVAAFGVGGINEVVTDGCNGLLAEPANVAALADRVTRLLEDPSLAAALGEGGYVQALELFDPRKSVQSVLNVYERVLANDE